MKRAIKLRGVISFKLDEKTYKKLRRLQSKKIMKTKQGCSFSQMVCLVLKKGLKKYAKSSFQPST